MSPKVMASFSAFGGDLPSIAFIVLHSLEGSVLWSSVSTNCLHVFLRCSFVVLVISSIICCRAGEVGSLDLRSSRALIFSNISAGTGSVLIRCRPEGICRDAAFRMMVRKIFSPFWQFDGSRLLLSLSSISLLYRSQFAFFKLKLVVGWLKPSNKCKKYQKGYLDGKFVDIEKCFNAAGRLVGGVVNGVIALNKDSAIMNFYYNSG